MIQERGGVWRVRSRSKAFPVDFSTGSSDLAQARQIAKLELDKGRGESVARGTLEEAVTAYRAMPKRCKDHSAEHNISRLRTIVRLVHGKELDAVKVAALSGLWHAYVAKRQGRQSADYSSRAPVNLSINSALRNAASIFRAKLRGHYKAAGIILPEDAGNPELLPEVRPQRSTAADSDLQTAWEALRASDIDMWLVIGLARFAGLRQGEILACRRSWIEGRDGGAVVRLMDRFADGHTTKTGREYTAPILHPALAEYLLALPAGAPVIARPDAAQWIAREPQQWVRPFVPGARLPLHRLRGLYADQIKRETETAIIARQAGLQAAQRALGHTTPETTERHYVSE